VVWAEICKGSKDELFWAEKTEPHSDLGQKNVFSISPESSLLVQILLDEVHVWVGAQLSVKQQEPSACGVELW
jgi:hypothetical protein